MSTVTPDDIEFLRPDAPLHTGRVCPVCRSRDPARPVLGVRSLADPTLPLTLLRCASCESLFYDPPDIRDFSDLDQIPDPKEWEARDWDPSKALYAWGPPPGPDFVAPADVELIAAGIAREQEHAR